MSFDDYLKAHGAYDDVAHDDNVHSAYRLFTGDVIPRESAAKLLETLLQPIFSGYNFAIVRLAERVFGTQEALAITTQLTSTIGTRSAGALAAKAQILWRSGDRRQALECVEHALKIGPDPAGHLANLKKRIADRSLLNEIKARTLRVAYRLRSRPQRR